jgi:hypothetical protein
MRHAMLATLVLAACGVGEITGPPPGSPDAAAGGPDGGGGTDAQVQAGSPDAAPAACKPAVATTASGQHNPGTACLSCHRAGGGAPTWTLAGTLYDRSAGGTAIAGATITVTDANGATFDLVSARNGNFWTSQPVAMPATIVASMCPDTVPMISTLSSGDCNSCHTGGGSPGRVHLP